MCNLQQICIVIEAIDNLCTLIISVTSFCLVPGTGLFGACNNKRPFILFSKLTTINPSTIIVSILLFLFCTHFQVALVFWRDSSSFILGLTKLSTALSGMGLTSAGQRNSWLPSVLGPDRVQTPARTPV